MNLSFGGYPIRVMTLSPDMKYFFHLFFFH